MTDLIKEIVANDTTDTGAFTTRGEAAGEDAAARGDGREAASGVGPFHEARRYRKRAQTAEKSLEDTRTELENAKKALAEREQTIASLERREQIDALLRESDAIDLEAARLLTELAVQRMSEPDAAPRSPTCVEASRTCSGQRAAARAARSRPGKAKAPA